MPAKYTKQFEMAVEVAYKVLRQDSVPLTSLTSGTTVFRSVSSGLSGHEAKRAYRGREKDHRWSGRIPGKPEGSNNGFAGLYLATNIMQIFQEGVYYANRNFAKDIAAGKLPGMPLYDKKKALEIIDQANRRYSQFSSEIPNDDIISKSMTENTVFVFSNKSRKLLADVREHSRFLRKVYETLEQYDEIKRMLSAERCSNLTEFNRDADDYSISRAIGLVLNKEHENDGLVAQSARMNESVIGPGSNLVLSPETADDRLPSLQLERAIIPSTYDGQDILIIKSVDSDGNVIEDRLADRRNVREGKSVFGSNDSDV